MPNQPSRGASVVEHIAMQGSRGSIVPFLGAGANLCGRPEGLEWQLGKGLPNAAELADYLCSWAQLDARTRDLAQVSQYVETMLGSGPLYQALAELFAEAFEPTPVHFLLTNLSVRLRSEGRQPLLIVTTNYDDMTERAFALADLPLDIVEYVLPRDSPGGAVFRHVLLDGSTAIINDPTEYRGLNLDVRPVLLKIHGAAHREDRTGDSFVITEDDYIEYLANEPHSSLLPAEVKGRLETSHILFLGYGLGDWNLRVFFRRLWGEGRPRFQSWSVQRNPDPLEHKFWTKRGVDILEMDLIRFVDFFEAALVKGDKPL